MRTLFPFRRSLRLVFERCGKAGEMSDEAARTKAITATLDLVLERIRQEIAAVGFCMIYHVAEKVPARTAWSATSIVRRLCPSDRSVTFYGRLLLLAKANHENLTRP